MPSEFNSEHDSRPSVAGRRRILFVEAPPTRYGSGISLETLIMNLDRDRFEPIVAIHAANPLQDALRDAAISTIPLALRGAGVKPIRAYMPLASAARDIPRHRRSNAWQTPPMVLARSLRDRWLFREEITILRQIIARQGIDIVHLNNLPSQNRFAYYAIPRLISIVQHVQQSPLPDSEHIRKLTKRVSAS